MNVINYHDIAHENCLQTKRRPQKQTIPILIRNNL